MAIQVPFPIPSKGYALNSKLRVNLDFIVDQFNQFNTGTATWDNVSVGTAGALTGTLTFYNASNAYYATFKASESSTGNQTYTWPTAVPASVTSILQSTTGGVMSWTATPILTTLQTTGALTSVGLNSTARIQAIGASVRSADTVSGYGLDILYPDSATKDSYIKAGNVTVWDTTYNLPVTTAASVSFIVSHATSQNITGALGLTGTLTVAAGHAVSSPSFTTGYNTIQGLAEGGAAHSYFLPANQGAANSYLKNNGFGYLEWDTDPGLGANNTLSNLAGGGTVAINESLLPGTSDTINLGSGAKTFRTVCVESGGVAFNDPASAYSVSLIAPSLAGNIILKLPDSIGTVNQVLTSDGAGNTGWAAVSATAASKALDNLASVAINTTLLPGSSNAIDLGSDSFFWRKTWSRSLYCPDVLVGGSGDPGTLTIFPSSVEKGKATFTATNNTGDTTTAFVVAAQAAARTYTIPDAGADASFVMTAGAQTIGGDKTFSSFPITPSAAPDADYEVANKKYVDDNSGGANTALSNLASVAINTSLVSDTDNTDDLGSSAKKWKDLYLAGNALFNTTISSAKVNIEVADAATTRWLNLTRTGIVTWRFETNTASPNSDLAIRSDAPGGKLVLDATAGTVIKGTTTNDNASAGWVGEYVESVITTLTNFPTSAQWGDLTSVSLTAGDWDVHVAMRATINSSTWASAAIGVSATSGNNNPGIINGYNANGWASSNTTPNSVAVTHYKRFSLSATTTVYLKYTSTYSSGTPQARGYIRARRVR